MKSKHSYFRGDEIRYTGNWKILYGQTCYEFVFLEGHKKGETGWTYRKHS